MEFDMKVSHACAICLMVVVTVPLLGAEPTGRGLYQDPRGLRKNAPYRFDWDLLLPAGDTQRTPTERSQTAIYCLLKEVRRPSTGRWSSEATLHHVTLHNILRYLGHKTVREGLDGNTIRKASIATEPGEQRDVLMLLRGLLGDREVTGVITAYLLEPKNPAHLRSVATEALGNIRDPQSIAVLFHVAESDEAWVTEPKLAIIGSERRTVYKFFLVRAAAKAALNSYDQDLLLSKAAKERLARLVTGMRFDDDLPEAGGAK